MAKPEHSVRVGGIQIAVWTNETTKGVMRSVTIDKSYKDLKGEWQRTKSYKDSDLPKIVLGLQEVMKKLWLKGEVIEPETKDDF